MPADVLQDAAAWLGGVFASRASQPVLYRRGTREVQLRATKGTSEIETLTAYGLIARSQSDDWLFEVDALVLPGIGKTTPEKDDQIRWRDGTTTHVYTVLPFGDSPEMWRYDGAFRKRIRVHTKHTGTET